MSRQFSKANTPVEDFVYHAKLLIAALSHVDPEDSLLGIERHVGELDRAAKRIGVVPPIEIATIPYPDGAIPHNAFLRNCLKGHCVIRYPGGDCEGEGGYASHAYGVQMLVEARKAAIVALEQWIVHFQERPITHSE